MCRGRGRDGRPWGVLIMVSTVKISFFFFLLRLLICDYISRVRFHGRVSNKCEHTHGRMDDYNPAESSRKPTSWKPSLRNHRETGVQGHTLNTEDGCSEYRRENARRDVGAIAISTSSAFASMDSAESPIIYKLWAYLGTHNPAHPKPRHERTYPPFEISSNRNPTSFLDLVYSSRIY